jgi:hypothetical protein
VERKCVGLAETAYVDECGSFCASVCSYIASNDDLSIELQLSQYMISKLFGLVSFARCDIATTAMVSCL